MRFSINRSVKSFALAACLGVVVSLPPSLFAASAAPSSDKAKSIVFESDLRPLFQKHCVGCHNPKKRKANLDLTDAESFLRGSESGPIFKSGEPEHSLLYELVHNGEMPRGKDKLPAADIELIRSWIAGGAKFAAPPKLVKEPPHQHDVTPILLLRCTVCHGPRKQDGGVDLRTRTAMLKGGDNGPAIVPGSPDKSRLIQRIESGACPPEGTLLKYFIKRPTSEDTRVLREWIAGGATEKDIEPDSPSRQPDPLVTDSERLHWAFQSPKPLQPPRIEPEQPSNPIDAFIGRKLGASGLTFSREAERTTLIRRACLDLTGLPPSVEELQRWRTNDSPRWYEEMIDDLLASPRYGERWARYWLDLAGYASSEGGISADTVRTVAWKYRDYVIRAFNDDKPYDRFLLEQLAGDELADYTKPDAITPEIVNNLVATGFLRMGIDQTGSRTMNFVPERIGVIGDAINVVSSGLMGVTMECARCHGHKYDPIPQRDYYRFKAIFQGAFDEHDWMSWKTRKLEVATPEDRRRHTQATSTIGKEIKTLESRRKRAVSSLQSKYFKERRPTLSDKLYTEFVAAKKAPTGRKTLRQLELLEEYETFLRPTEAQLKALHPELKAELAEIDSKLPRLRKELPPPLTIRALWDRGDPSPSYILVRGEHNRPGRLVGPGVPSALTDGRTPFEAIPPWKGAKKTGRRLAFAKWLTQPDHPLTARVLVNRVWKHHFGVGLVKTLDNFGVQGARPSHPELLDWLAIEFTRNGWSIKELHRQMMTSRTYRQVSGIQPEHAAVDPQNQLLARMSLRRLDAEALRDSLLYLAGQLDERMYGPADPVGVREDGLIMAELSDNGWRRSIYLRFRRTELPSLLDTFDYPEMGPNCGERSVSTVSLQALMLSNNRRVFDLAADFARQIRNDAGNDFSAQATRVYAAALGREPDAEELQRAVAALQTMKAHWTKAGTEPNDAAAKAIATLCHTVLNSAEFLYVD